MKRCTVLLLLVLSIYQSTATHFRFATISWDQVTGGQGRYFRFTIDSAWRRTFFDSGNFNVGAVLVEPDTFFLPSTQGPDRFGFSMTVNSINVAADWFIGQQVILFEFARDGTFVSAFQACCRISTLLNNPGLGYRVQTTVLVERNALRKSIKTTAIPIVTLVSGQATTFSIPSLSQENEVLRYRLASGTEASNGDAGGSYKNPSGLTVDYLTGVLRWTPTATGLSSVQVVIEGYGSGFNPQSPANLTGFQTAVAVDFIVEVISSSDSRCKRFCSNAGAACSASSQCFSCVENGFPSTREPYCDRNFAPVIRNVLVNGVLQARASNYIVEALSGAPFSLSVTADDADPEDVVTVTSTASPSGSTSVRTIANPGALNISWVPTLSQGGSLICFTASDSLSNPSTGQTCVEVRIRSGDMLAYGQGLTRATAGRPTTIQIDNFAEPPRTHSLTITGPQTHTVNSVLVSSPSPRGPAYALHNVTYNPNGPNNPVITVAGFYSLTIAETTVSVVPKPPNLVFSLQVVPDVTAACDILDSTDAMGGVEGRSVSFSIRSRDRYGNLVQTSTATDSYRVTIEYNGQNTSSITTVMTSAGIYRGQYVVPTRVGSLNTFRVLVSLVAGSDACAIRTPSISFAAFNAFITAQSSFVAGQDIIFNVTRTQGTQSVPVFVNNVPASVSAGTASGANTVFTARLNGGLTVAGAYLNQDGLRVATSGFETSQSFVIVPNVPFGPKCYVSGDLSDAAAGDNAVITVQLRDAYDNVITNNSDSVRYRFVHSALTEAIITGTAQLDELTKLYRIPFLFTRTGSVNLNLTLGSTGAPIGASPYTLIITPGEISLTQSAVSNPETISAGTQGVLTISALDNYANERDPTLDSFQISFASAKVTGNSSLTASRNSNKYFITFDSTVAGYYALTIKAFLPSQGGFLVFRTVTIRVLASDIVPELTSGSGAGMSGGVIGQQSQLLIQTRDKFNNVVEAERGILIIAKVFHTSVDNQVQSTYATGVYRPPTLSQCFSQGSFYVLQSSIDDLTAEEQVLAPEGYFELFYLTPRVGQFNFTIYLADKDEVGALTDGDAIIALPSTKQAFTSTALSRRAGSGLSTEDNVGLIIGLILGSIVLSAASMYGVWRLKRYRQKYHTEKKRADEAEKDLQDMAAEIDIIPGGREYDAVGAATVTANPLHELNANRSDAPMVQAVEDPTEVTMKSERPVTVRREFKPEKLVTSFGDKDMTLPRGRDAAWDSSAGTTTAQPGD